MVDIPQMLPYASIEPKQPPVGTEEPRPRPAGEAPGANNIQRGRRNLELRGGQLRGARVVRRPLGATRRR